MLGSIITFQVNACKNISLPIFQDFIMLFEDLEKVVGIFLTHIFNSKDINNKAKLDGDLGVFT